ncbi:(2Fe-2S)-binding protein [Neobacillus jeddahensis]|uniref:(2Fe-2S)-binding protein n=1 Tax=Neobacillus jeddahensis TaxID=1461580 RepID=UPI00058DE51B|nr:(2Fe-2S)-binding protein [Neobacillus jeddahensis]
MKSFTISLTINGEEKMVPVMASDTLLFVIRHHLGLTGAKPSCLNGDCGACTVHIDGRPMKSCLMLAVEAAGKKVTTIEGLQGTPIQQAFIEKFAFQCGYCTPGFIMNCQALVEKHPDADDQTIKEWLSSNICRCTSYAEIEEAVKSVLKKK